MQLTASIAHEVNQPLSAIINYAKSGKRWLGRDEPELGEVADCLDHIVANGTRAANVMLDYAFNTLRLHKVIIRAINDNDDSLKVDERLGFNHEG